MTGVFRPHQAVIQPRQHLADITAWNIVSKGIAPAAQALICRTYAQGIQHLTHRLNQIRTVGAVVTAQQHDKIGTIQAGQLRCRPVCRLIGGNDFLDVIAHTAQPGIGLLTIVHGIDGSQIALTEDQHMPMRRRPTGFRGTGRLQAATQLIDEILTVGRPGDFVGIQFKLQRFYLAILFFRRRAHPFAHGLNHRADRSQLLHARR